MLLIYAMCHDFEMILINGRYQSISTQKINTHIYRSIYIHTGQDFVQFRSLSLD